MEPDEQTLNERRKHGLSGNSGFVPGLGHVNAPYGAATDEVFVVEQDDEDDYPRWARVPYSSVTDARRIITCSYCKKPAVRVDHSWPMLVGGTSCADHKDRYDADLTPTRARVAQEDGEAMDIPKPSSPLPYVDQGDGFLWSKLGSSLADGRYCDDPVATVIRPGDMAYFLWAANNAPALAAEVSRLRAALTQAHGVLNNLEGRSIEHNSDCDVHWGKDCDCRAFTLGIQIHAARELARAALAGEQNTQEKQ